MGRVGGGAVPEGSRVKPWRFELVAEKKEPTGLWYVCLFVPYVKSVKPKGKRCRTDEDMQGAASSSSSPLGSHPSSVGEGSSGEESGLKRPAVDSSVESGISMLVETLFQKARSEGLLTRGDQQEREFRKSVTQSLKTVTEPFQGRDMRVQWPDFVFEDAYVRLTFAEVCQHFEERKHLPHLRSAKEVEDTGVDLVADHVNLVESVENLYLYLRDFMQKSQKEKSKSEEEIMQLRTLLTHQTLDSQVPGNIAGARTKLRKRLWDALKVDDAALLIGIVEEGARTFNVEASELMVLLDRWIWKNSAGKGKSGRAVGLLAVAATNIKGVPEEGALQCLKAILRRFSNEAQVASLPEVIKRAQSMGRTRVVAVLRDALDAPVLTPPSQPEVEKSGCVVSQIAKSETTATEALLCTGKGGKHIGGVDEDGAAYRESNKGGEPSGGKEGDGWLRKGILVSSMLYKKEEELFCEFAVHLGRQARFKFVNLSDGWRSHLTKTLQHALQHQHITVSVKGSVEKGTDTWDSDVDVFIDTHGRLVSRQEKQQIVELLRTTDGFHHSHVELKKLAIGCVVDNMEVDLVFSDTAEYGRLPGNFIQRFQSDKVVQNAARMLKICFHNSSSTSLPPEKVPSFVLETLVLEAQDYRSKIKLSDVLSDGSMELFCDALQLLVDSPQTLNSAQAKLFALASGEAHGLRGTKLGDSKLISAQRHACDLLHLLCASRFYSPEQKGFTNLFDIERWIRKYNSTEVFNTPLGPVPSWIMGRIDNEEEGISPFLISGMTHPGNFQSHRTLQECKDTVQACHAAFLFLQGPTGRYTATGAAQIHDDSSAKVNGLSFITLTNQIQRLHEDARSGSQVAQNMFITRKFWLMAEFELEKGDFESAVTFFALSAKSSSRDGDPFSGLWTNDDGYFGRYHKAIDFVSTRTTEAQCLDAKLVQAWICMHQNRWSKVEEILTEGIQQGCAKMGSVDTAFYRMRCICRGNTGNWRGVLEDTQSWIQSEPADSIAYFWHGVARRNLYEETRDAGERHSKLDLRRDAFRRFIKIAPQDGRKVCQAWWDLAMCEMQKLSPSTEEKFKIGDVVTVVGLQAKPQHNEKAGTVIGYQNDRVQVQLQDDDQTEVAFKPMNLVSGVESEKNGEKDHKWLSVMEMIDQGFKAEQKMLPILREHEAKSEDSCSKQLCKNFRLVSELKGKNPTNSPLIQDALKMLRERGTKAFRSQKYEEAVHEYSSLLEMNTSRSFPELHIVLSNRSAAYEKMQEYGAAREDALEVIKLKPDWVKGYVRLVRAQIGCRNAADALHDLKKAQENLSASDFDQMLGLEQEVQSLLAKEATRCEPASFACWPSVRFKDSVIVVDTNGSGDFVSLRQALGALDTPSTIIVLAGSYTLHGWPDLNIQSFQVIGEGIVHIASEGGNIAFVASGAHASMFLENLRIHSIGTATRHCVGVCSGASASITRCEMRSTGAACYSDGKDSSLLLLQCRACGPGAGPLVTNYGFLEAEDCRFTGSKFMGVEVRMFGSCLLKKCTMSDNAGQGFCLYQGGLEAELRDCTIQKCGRINRSAAVMVCSGNVRLRRCSIVDNRGDGIVVQDEDGSAHLDLNSCRVHSNGGAGIVMYGGSGNIVDNRVQENGMMSVGIHCNVSFKSAQGFGGPLPFRKISVVRNTFCSNGPPIVISAPQKMMRKLITFDNNNSGSADPAIFMVHNSANLFNAENINSTMAEIKADIRQKIFSGHKIIPIDICTGLELSWNSLDDSRASFQQMQERAASRARMQRQLPENHDFAFVHFNKESLVAAHRRQNSSNMFSQVKLHTRVSPFSPDFPVVPSISLCAL